MRKMIIAMFLIGLVSSAAAFELPQGELVPRNSVYHPPALPEVMLAASVTEYMLAYDGEPEYYFPSLDSVGAEWAVRFTPPQACSLSYFELTTFKDPVGSGSVALTIYAGDSASGPTSAISSTVTFTASGDASRQRIEFETPLSVGSGDFFIGIKVVNASSPHITGDGDGGTGRSWYRGPTQAWDWVEDVDMNIRAYVIPYGADATAPVVVHYPDPAVYAGDGQTAIAAQVTDASGLQAVTLRYSTNQGASYLSVPMSLTRELYRATIPAQLPTTTVKYYITATDNSPQHNQATNPAAGASSPNTYTTLSGMQLKYDDGWPAYFMVVSEISNGNAFAVLFTPTTFPIKVTRLRVYVSETAPFKLSLRAASTPQPGAVIAGPFTISASTAPGWAEVDIPEAAQPVVTAGHFFVVLEWLSSSPATPGVAADTLSPDGRSLWYDNAQGWADWPYADWIIRAVYTTPVGVVEAGSGSTPSTFDLAQNYPNPFNPRTTIEYALPAAAPVALAIYNVRGQRVRSLDLGMQGPGSHRLEWDGCDDHGRSAASGMYYYRLTAGDQIRNRKMVLLK